MRHVEKRFLSDCSGETGSMVTEVETRRVKDLGEYENHISPYITAQVQVRDCNGRPTNLDFDAHDQKSFIKRLDKLDGMIAQLQRMRVQYHEQWYSHVRDCEFKKKELEGKKRGM